MCVYGWAEGREVGVETVGGVGETIGWVGGVPEQAFPPGSISALLAVGLDTRI